MDALTAARRLDLDRHIGTELSGVQLLDLDPDEVEALVRLIADRGVVVVRDQPMTLDDHIDFARRLGSPNGVEFQCRVRWAPNTVTFWDNRCVQHHASWDYFPETRSGWRVTTTGERPYVDRRPSEPESDAVGVR